MFSVTFCINVVKVKAARELGFPPKQNAASISVMVEDKVWLLRHSEAFSVLCGKLKRFLRL